MFIDEEIKAAYEQMKQILSVQFSEEFVRKMKARVFFGYFRYGESKRYKTEKKYNIKDTIQKRLDKYWETGNSEHLVDTANFLMIEYMHPQHPNAHFESIEEEDESKRLGVVRNIKDAEALIRADNENERGLK